MREASAEQEYAIHRRRSYAIPRGHTVFAYVFLGEAAFDDNGETVKGLTLVVFGDGDYVKVKAGSLGARFVLVSGKPLDEPIARYGPFVMNTEAEIQEALKDLRRGTLHKYLGVSPNPGISDILTNTLPIERHLLKNLHPNLDFLPRGTYPTDPSELLMTECFSNLLKELSTQYDFVLIDTPPVMLVTDSILISAHTGINYLVLGSGVHQPAEIEITIKRLQNAGIHLQGSIFNVHTAAAAKVKTHRKYGKYNYYYDEAIKR